MSEAAEGSQRFLSSDLDSERDQRNLRALFKAHTSPAFLELLDHRADVNLPGTALSLATCEKVPTTSAIKAENHPDEYELVDRISPATQAIQASLSRSRERQRKVLALIQAGEPAHAKRLANCRRKSVQLECPTMAGGCGSDENYVPVSCGSRLCPDCMKQRQGQLAGKYGPVVAGWDHPTTFRLGSPKRVEPERIEDAIEALRGAIGRLRRRVIPPDGDGWNWDEWKRALQAVGERDLAKYLEVNYVKPAKHSVDTCPDCYTERIRCEDTHTEGHSVDECPKCESYKVRCEYAGSMVQGIPFDEVVPSGFYGIDVKQGEDGTMNVHAHVLADIPWLPQAALSELWGEIHAAPNVDIRRVDGRGEEDMEDAVMEVVGYAAKAPEFLDEADEVEYLTALKGSKLIQPFGDLHGNTPKPVGLLRCCNCEAAPRYWNYVDVVDGEVSTALVGDGTRGDRPPPGG